MSDLTIYFSKEKMRTRKRLGRGNSSGGGKTAGRGTKGQRSRSGANRKIPHWFEGGQTSFFQKIAKKKGFSRRRERVTMTTDLINAHFKEGEIVNRQSLLDKSLIRKSQLRYPIKLVLKKPLKRGLKLEDITLSKSLEDRDRND